VYAVATILAFPTRLVMESRGERAPAPVVELYPRTRARVVVGHESSRVSLALHVEEGVTQLDLTPAAAALLAERLLHHSRRAQGMRGRSR
jgi:hypothetical protein